ncbi:extensin-like [Penaeus monodon]|uniref:extensin-like n=1 Tax=Penaeus monodon TaxID=6687 RepID=UPI0018A7D991|nr:extensin-like [Penaeus monodon]
MAQFLNDQRLAVAKNFPDPAGVPHLKTLFLALATDSELLQPGTFKGFEGRATLLRRGDPAPGRTAALRLDRRSVNHPCKPLPPHAEKNQTTTLKARYLFPFAKPQTYPPTGSNCTQSNNTNPKRLPLKHCQFPDPQKDYYLPDDAKPPPRKRLLLPPTAKTPPPQIDLPSNTQNHHPNRKAMPNPRFPQPTNPRPHALPTTPAKTPTPPLQLGPKIQPGGREKPEGLAPNREKHDDDVGP